MATSEEKKEYLRGYEKAVRQMKRQQDIIIELRCNKMFPSCIIDDMPRAHNSSDLSGYAVRLETEEKKYLKFRYQRIKKCQEIKNKIERLENEDEKDILIYRYIKLMKWENICTELEHSWQHTHRIHARALENLEI